MVNAMPAGQYIKYLKSAKMLRAEMRMQDIETASFPHMKKQDDRDKIMREVKRASEQFLFAPLKDFAEVAANFAKGLKNG